MLQVPSIALLDTENNNRNETEARAKRPGECLAPEINDNGGGGSGKGTKSRTTPGGAERRRDPPLMKSHCGRHNSPRYRRPPGVRQVYTRLFVNATQLLSSCNYYLSSSAGRRERPISVELNTSRAPRWRILISFLSFRRLHQTVPAAALPAHTGWYSVYFISPPSTQPWRGSENTYTDNPVSRHIVLMRMNVIHLCIVSQSTYF